MVIPKRIAIRFQAEVHTRLGKLLDYLASAYEERTVRDLMQEAIESHWMPTCLVKRYRSGEISLEQYRHEVRLALWRQQSWITYCQQMTEVDLEIPVGEIPPADFKGKPLPVQISEGLQPPETGQSAQVPAEIEEEALPLPPLAKPSQADTISRRSRSMKPLFGGAFQEES